MFKTVRLDIAPRLIISAVAEPERLTPDLSGLWRASQKAQI
jgi:hypothetical protein